MKQIIAAVVLCWCVPQLAWAECLRYGYLDTGDLAAGFSGGKFSEGVVAKVEIEGSFGARPKYTVYLDSYKNASQQALTCGLFSIGGYSLSSNATVSLAPETEASAAKMAMMAYTLNQFLEGDIPQTTSRPEFSHYSKLSLKRR